MDYMQYPPIELMYKYNQVEGNLNSRHIRHLWARILNIYFSPENNMSVDVLHDFDENMPGTSDLRIPQSLKRLDRTIMLVRSKHVDTVPNSQDWTEAKTSLVQDLLSMRLGEGLNYPLYGILTFNFVSCFLYLPLEPGKPEWYPSNEAGALEFQQDKDKIKENLLNVVNKAIAMSHLV